MDFRKIFFPIYGIWLVDFGTTVIFLNFMTGLQEGNPLMAKFFSYGFEGWILALLFATIVMLLFSVLIYGSYKFANFLSKKHMWDCMMVWYIPVVFFVILELFTVINNIRLMIGVL